MNLKKQEELQENLDFLRERFDELNQGIELPHSLSSDMLLYKLNHLEGAESCPQPAFRWRALAGVAACFVFVCGSLFAATQISGSKNAIPQTAGAAADTPMLAAAVPQDAAAEFDAAAEEPEMAAFAAPPLEADALEQAADEGAGVAPRLAKSQADGIGEAELLQEETENEQDRDKWANQEEMLDSLEMAQASEPFGGYLPGKLPAGLEFSSAYLSDEALSAVYLSPDSSKELWIRVCFATEETYAHMADLSDPDTYDLRRYSVPYADSIPEDLWWVAGDVVFPSEQLTLPLLEARILPYEDIGDQKKWYGQVSVIQPGEVVVQYTAAGLSPEELFSIF